MARESFAVADVRTLVAVPIVDVLGFMNGDRYLPDRRDLDRSFPGAQLARRPRRPW